MVTFIIDAENNITAMTQEEVVAGIPEGSVPFTSAQALGRLAAD